MRIHTCNKCNAPVEREAYNREIRSSTGLTLSVTVDGETRNLLVTPVLSYEVKLVPQEEGFTQDAAPAKGRDAVENPYPWTFIENVDLCRTCLLTTANGGF